MGEFKIGVTKSFAGLVVVAGCWLLVVGCWLLEGGTKVFVAKDLLMPWGD